MKRKDWISLIALLIIIGIALIGEQFHLNGEWRGGAISIIINLVPLLVFFIIAVVFRNKKGSYVKWFRGISYISFAVSVVFLYYFSKPFMHYFNVIGSQDDITTAAEQIINDCNVMFKEYEEQINHRVNKYESELKSEINQGHIDFLKNEFPTVNNFDNRFVTKTVSDMKESVWFANYYVNDSIRKTKQKEFEGVLIDNFDTFRAASELNQLIKQYNDYKKLLSDDFSRTTPFERKDNYDALFNYINNEEKWINIEDYFTKMNFNIIWFAVFIVLAFLACASFIFFKDDSVRAPRPRLGAQSIYEEGFNMNFLNNSEFD